MTFAGGHAYDHYGHPLEEPSSPEGLLDDVAAITMFLTPSARARAIPLRPTGCADLS